MSHISGFYYLKKKVAKLQIMVDKQAAQIASLKANEEKGWEAAQAYWRHMGWFRRWLWYRTHK